MKQNFLSLLDDITTPEELAILVAEITKCRALLFSRKHTPKFVLDSLPISIRRALPADIEQTQSALDEWLNQINTQLQKTPVATVTIAYLPSAQQARELTDLVRAETGAPFLVQLRTDPHLMAGVRIEFASKRLEYSLQNDVGEVLKEMYGDTH